MAKVIGVRFKNAGKLYFFDPGEIVPQAGDYVLVETVRGIELGEVATTIREMEEERLVAPLKTVIRVADEQDIQHAKDNEEKQKDAFRICQEKIAEHGLDMKLVNAEYTFDNSKIQFYFTSGGRVDFRMLVKDLAAIFKTRIDLRQIGVRDEAKMLGGLGPCGRVICCGSFLGDFQPVSIKMAKEQSLSLNPTKISGVCGRLMCCLKYEQDTYEATRKRMPKPGKEVTTPDGIGTVWEVNVIKETVRVRIQKGDSGELKDYPLEDVQRLHPAQNEKHKEKPESDRKESNEVVTDELQDMESIAVTQEQLVQELSQQAALVVEAEQIQPELTQPEPKQPQMQTSSTPSPQPQPQDESPWKKAVADALKAAEMKRRGE